MVVVHLQEFTIFFLQITDYGDFIASMGLVS